MAAEHFKNWVERQADALRALCSLSPFARLDPYALAMQMKVRVLQPQQITGLHSETLQQLLDQDSSAWSAGSLHLPNGLIFVVMNPTHQETRKRMSLMEELAHVKLSHKPSELMTFDGFVYARSYNKSQETEAYWVGAAALLPRRVIKGARSLGWTAEKVARDHGLSVELVRFREKVVGITLERAAPFVSAD